MIGETVSYGVREQQMPEPAPPFAKAPEILVKISDEMDPDEPR